MDSIAVKNHVAAMMTAVRNDVQLVEKESCVEKMERQISELEKRAGKYFNDLDAAEVMCKQAQDDVKRFQLKAAAEMDIAKKDAKIQAKLFSSLKEITEKVKRMETKDDTQPSDEKMPDAARNALRYTTSARVCRYFKIGCALVFDAVAAYGLFKITRPYFF